MSLYGEIRKICRDYEIEPRRQRGQNFLINEKILDRIVATADIKQDDIVLEIGAGLGAITKKLAEKAKKVIAVEIDKKLVEILKDQLKNYKNAEIIQGDILDERVLRYLGTQVIRYPNPQVPKHLCNYKVVANLPFNITGRVLRKFLSEEPKPELMVLILQREVVQRICAKPGQMSQLAVMVQFFSQPNPIRSSSEVFQDRELKSEAAFTALTNLKKKGLRQTSNGVKIVAKISKNNFWPAPRVDSAILKITQIHTNRNTDTHRFFEVMRAGFSAPRKYLLNNLIKRGIIKREESEKIWQKLGWNFKIRAQELSVEDWIELSTNVQISSKYTNNLENQQMYKSIRIYK